LQTGTAKLIHVCADFIVKPNTDSVLCNGNINLGVSGTYEKYNWSTGDTTATISINKPGSYSVNVIQNQLGYLCPGSTTIHVTTTGPTAVMSGNATLCNDVLTTSP